MQICLVRVDGYNQSVQSIFCPPQLLQFFQHAMAGSGQEHEVAKTLGSHPRLHLMVIMVREKSNKIQPEASKSSYVCFHAENEDRDLGKGNVGFFNFGSSKL